MREVLFVESMHPNTKEIESEFNIVQEELAANQAKLVTLKADVAELEVTKRELMDYREEKVKIRSRVTEARERLSSDKKNAVEKQWYQVGLEILGAPLISFPETETPMEDEHGAVGDDKALDRGTKRSKRRWFQTTRWGRKRALCCRRPSGVCRWRRSPWTRELKPLKRPTRAQRPFNHPRRDRSCLVCSPM